MGRSKELDERVGENDAYIWAPTVDQVQVQTYQKSRIPASRQRSMGAGGITACTCALVDRAIDAS